MGDAAVGLLAWSGFETAGEQERSRGVRHGDVRIGRHVDEEGGDRQVVAQGVLDFVGRKGKGGEQGDSGRGPGLPHHKAEDAHALAGERGGRRRQLEALWPERRAVDAGKCEIVYPLGRRRDLPALAQELRQVVGVGDRAGRTGRSRLRCGGGGLIRGRGSVLGGLGEERGRAEGEQQGRKGQGLVHGREAGRRKRFTGGWPVRGGRAGWASRPARPERGGRCLAGSWARP